MTLALGLYAPNGGGRCEARERYDAHRNAFVTHQVCGARDSHAPRLGHSPACCSGTYEQATPYMRYCAPLDECAAGTVEGCAPTAATEAAAVGAAGRAARQRWFDLGMGACRAGDGSAARRCRLMNTSALTLG